METSRHASAASRSLERLRDDASEEMSSVIEHSYSDINPILADTQKKHGSRTVSVGVGPDEQLAATEPVQETSNVKIDEECKYQGDLYDEKKHGKGVLSWPDGRVYTGAFFADRRHGFGIFHTPNTSEFKGLFCHDERFGPGILIYQPLQSADVGIWLSEDLIRLLYPHPKLTLELRIIDKRSSHSAVAKTPSWTSPLELLRTMSDYHLLLHKKSPRQLLRESAKGTISLSRYISEHADGARAATQDRRKELDAYLTSVQGSPADRAVQESISNERTADVTPPNNVYEQQRLYEFVNKFWPLKQRASFSIDDIISNTRSSFPTPGPLENASVNLFELSYHGYEKDVRHLLMQRLVYVDVCDSQGLTALHFATYNLHINIINTLLDFGGNVNQVSDDALTPLMLAFLLYYGNDHRHTRNLALEHIDPVLPNPRVLLTKDKTGASNGMKIIDEVKLPESIEAMTLNESETNNPYGFELTDELRERIRHEPFRERVYAVIALLLRRGADPSYSDWPLPVLAIAVRAGDKRMVELLLRKRADVNCQLNAARHACLTPLHIVCGCLAPDVVDIARQLLEHGAQVNAESFPNNKEYFSLIDPLVLDLIKTVEMPANGRTPLHVACTRELSANTLNLVRLLLQHGANPNAVCNGQTPLTLAIAFGNEPLVDLLLNHDETDPSTVLGFGNGNALCLVLSTFYETCWTYPKRLQLIERLIAKNPKVLYPARFGPKNLLGSCVDYAYYMFFADTRIALSPYHSLTNEERIIFNQRKELLAYIARRFREEVTRYEGFLRLSTPAFDGSYSNRSNSQGPSSAIDRTSRAAGEFRYCGACGRGIGVRLAICRRCQKVSFCSKACIVNGWNTFHRYECRQSANPSARPHTTAKTKNLSASDNALFKDGLKDRANDKGRLPPLSKILRQNRLKKRMKSASLEGIELSWNTVYNAPENYSFN